MQQEAMFKLQLYALQNPDAVHSRKMSMPKPIDASLDDDRINFFVLGAGANAVTYGVNADIKNIWVPKDVDNIHVHNLGRFYLTYGFSYGKSAADALAEMSISAQIGYGFMENVHPYDDLGAIFENAAGFEISYSAGSSSLGMVVGKSKGKNGTVPIYFFFGDYGQGLKTKQKMPLKTPVSIKGEIYGKELKRNVSVPVNAADTGKVILNNPSNNLPPMTMDKILMKK